jgi:hypothetical protein
MSLSKMENNLTLKISPVSVTELKKSQRTLHGFQEIIILYMKCIPHDNIDQYFLVCFLSKSAEESLIKK